MIYFDNGATTFPKPPAVRRAVMNALQNVGANPGRSGHRMAQRAGEIIYECRKNTARLLGVPSPENVIFTYNCTTALNTVIHGLLRKGDHAVISCLEHNAVVRPLEELKSQGISFTAVDFVYGDDDKTLDNFRAAIRVNTRLVVCTAASNVFGVRLPVERLAAMCRIYNIPFCVDAAQTAGCVPVNMEESGIDFLCCAGHKGLYGPMGTGILALNGKVLPRSLTQGGTGSFSSDPMQPEILPDKYESGTPNLPGIAGLNEGVRFVLSKGVDRIFAEETRKAQRLYDLLRPLDLSPNERMVRPQGLDPEQVRGVFDVFQHRCRPSEKPVAAQLHEIHVGAVQEPGLFLGKFIVISPELRRHMFPHADGNMIRFPAFECCSNAFPFVYKQSSLRMEI